MTTTTWNGLSTWLDRYLAECLGTVAGYEYAPTGQPEGTGTLVTVGFMPELEELVTITGYDFPEHDTGGRTGAVTARVQVRTRAATRARALELAEDASRHLINPNLTTRLDAVARINVQPLGQAPSGSHEATTNLLVTTIERTA